MTQIAIYIEEKLAERLDKAVKATGKSKSKWVSDAIRLALQDQWPDGFFDLAGSWADDVGPKETIDRIRKGTNQMDVRQEIL